MACRIISGIITYYFNDEISGVKKYKSKLDRDRSIALFLNRVKKISKGISYYTILPNIKLPEETVERNIQKHKAKNGIGKNFYGHVIKRQRNYKPYDEKK